jgi:hypothetical protein
MFSFGDPGMSDGMDECRLILEIVQLVILGFLPPLILWLVLV